MKKLSTLNSFASLRSGQLSTPRGFTLIELILVFSMIGIISIFGIASFISYNKSQTLNTAVSDVTAMLNLAKSRASSQFKPTGGNCDSRPLDGYQVVFTTTTYSLNAICGGSVDSLTNPAKTLSQPFTFDASRTFLFHSLSGGVDCAPTSCGTAITINGYSGQATKTITVYADGRIVTN